MLKTLRALVSGATAGVLLLGLLTVPMANAQELPSGFAAPATEVAQAALTQINSALAAGDAATAKASLQPTVAPIQTLQGVLQNALAVASTDAERSRANALLAHVNAALDSVQHALEAEDLSTVQSLANAARGEIIEALNEMPSVATAQPAPAQPQQPSTLPKAGGFPIELASLAGFAALMAGAGLRRLRR
jgi:hypothetical protein